MIPANEIGGQRRLVGLIVNPVAGLGGRVGLKGSDGADIQLRALELGAVPRSLDRTTQALMRLLPMLEQLTLLTCSGDMGEDAARGAGFDPTVIGASVSGHTTAEDTKAAARAMLARGVDLLLFAGGDGTARDLYQAVGEDVVVLGIPTGVKVHSAAYAIGPTVAGDLARAFLSGKVRGTREAEVHDVDEQELRRGTVCTRFYGVLHVPDDARRIQGAKAGSVRSDTAAATRIAKLMVRQMNDSVLYIVGPGTTTRSIFSELGIDKGLLSVDVIFRRELLAADVNEAQLLKLLAARTARIVVTPIGGQGYLFGRGNQQLSPEVLGRVGVENIMVIAAPGKLNKLTARPLLVDTGDDEIDQRLAGYVRVTCGPDDARIVRVAAAKTPDQIGGAS
jgi:predicted polyphosphate/ATP-dependent NAD kinase